MILNDRTYEFHVDELGNESYFLHGHPDIPLPKKVVIEDENEFYELVPIGTNSYNEKVYVRRDK